MSKSSPAKRAEHVYGAKPAKGYSWPKFEKGVATNEKHGAQSPVKVGNRAQEIVPMVFETHPHLDTARDGPAVYRYAAVLARGELVYEWLDKQEHPVFKDEEAGSTHGVYDRLERWEGQCDKAEAALCISPAARAKLGLTEMHAKSLADATLKQFMIEQASSA